MVRTILFLLLIVFGGTISAQNSQSDSIKSEQNNAADSTKRVCSTYYKPNITLKSAIVPISLVTVGVIVETLPSNVLFGKKRIQQQVQKKMNGFRTSADDFLQFAPIAVMFGLKMAGTKSRSDLLNQIVITAKSELLVSAIVFSMKHFISDMRPDGSTDNTMPSGHTAQAFVSATLLDMEYRNTSPWISIGGYVCATATGYLRVANNRHWASDVLIGAGIGIASVKLVYLTHRYRWCKMSKAVLVPTLYQNGGGVAFAMKF
jgi:membrane-associated phospholipid phosphatase